MNENNQNPQFTKKKYNKISENDRKRIAELVVDQAKPQIEVAKIFNIKKSTVFDIVKRYRETGSVSKLKKGGAKNIIFTSEIKEKLLKLILDNCTITLSEMICKLEINVSIVTVWRWLKSMEITLKLTRPVPLSRNSDRVKDLRKDYAEWYQRMPPPYRYTKHVYVDESPFHLHMLRSYGRAPKGVTPNPILQNNKGKNITMILAVSGFGVVHCEAIFSNVNTEIFQQFLLNVQSAVGNNDFTITMDNCSIHHSNNEFYDNFEPEIHYLPPYSPFLNPCEEVFSLIKSRIRKHGPLNGRDDLVNRMKNAALSITQNEAQSFIHHSEQFMGKCFTKEDILRN